MSTTTTRNSLVKPGYADAADIAVINTNYDTLDASFAKCNWAGGAAPTVNDDFATDGYSIGSIWFDTTNHKLYIAETVGTGSATWKEITMGTLTGYVKTDGSTPLTANWDVGAYKVTANQLESDVADGTAPIVSTSKTVCTNLNADMVDGIHGPFIEADGTQALTAAWDAGAYKITADTFTSDVANGTAPFTATSTTACTNLNADLLDGREGAAHAILAGQAGGQTLYGGTASGNDLTLIGTSDATEGSVIIPQGGLVIGTKATTATNEAILIHEGAAGASNKIVFLDGDGTTEAASIYKSSASDAVILQASTYTASLASSDGVLTSNGGFTVSKVATDSAGAYAISTTLRPTITSTAATTNYNLYTATFPEVRTGVTSSGNIYDFYTETMRNHNGAATDDDGTHSGAIYAMQGFFGHYSSNTSMKGTTTYVDGMRFVPYYEKGTISNLFCVEIATGGTGGTVTNNWSIYDSHPGNNYYNATYNRFQSTTGDRVIYVVQTSTTDPIADAWNTHSNERYKNDLGTIDPDIDRKARYEARKAVADKTLHVWTRKTDLEDPAHYEAMFPLEDDRMRGPPSDEKPPKDLEVRQAEQDLAIYRHIEKCKTLKKFQKPNIGLFAEDAPEEIRSYGITGEVEGIDLGAYIGWVHRTVDAMHYDLDFLEVDVADMDKMMWEKEAQLYALEKAQEESQAKIEILESKNDALLKKHEDYERRMALLEERLAKLELV